jgi:hypothetical protein
LEGAYFPPPISWWLSTDQTKNARDLEDEEQRFGRLYNEIRKYQQRIGQEIDRARDDGVAKHKNAAPMQTREAKRRVERLQSRLRRQRLIDFRELEQGGTALLVALRNNCADERELAPTPTPTSRLQRLVLRFKRWRDERQSNLLDQMYTSWMRVVAYAGEKAVTEYSRTVYQKQQNFGSIRPKDEPNWILMYASTEFGNHAAALRSFFEKRFQFDFEFFWPMVQLAAQGDQKTIDALTNAKQKLDFCVRILLYTVTFTATWLIVGVFQAGNAWIILALGTGGFALTALWLEMVHSNYRSLSELIRNIVILKRFDVLKMLNQSLPQTWESEQALWKELTTQLLWGSHAEIKYQHGNK